MTIRPFFAGLLLALTTLAPLAQAGEPAIVYLTRHGEKMAVEKDPDLTPRGHGRARNLATALSKAGIKHIFSTPTKRTRQTAQPLAAHLGLAVQAYDPAKAAALVASVKALPGPTLVVGHSNTLAELVTLFGGKPGPKIEDEEYDRLYQLIINSDGSVTTVLLSSLPG